VKKKYKLYLLLVIIVFLIPQSYAQEAIRLWRFGVNYGIGTQQIFPYNNPDYSYMVKNCRVLINYTLKSSGILSYELQIEPGIYSARHQLLNEYFVQPSWGPDYMEQRAIQSPNMH
jgi:hypothetical protein